MGLIQTAMMTGAAMYGVKQLANTAQGRWSDGNNRRYSTDTTTARREESRQDPSSYHPRPLEFRHPRPSSEYNNCPRTAGERAGYYADGPAQQVYHIDDQPLKYDQPYYSQAEYDDGRSYRYAPRMHSEPARPAVSGWPGQPQQQGFVDPREIADDLRGSIGTSRAHILDKFADQALSMASMTGSGGKNKKGEFMKNLMGN